MENRYKTANSGSGSYGKLAEFKAEIINKFVEENQINSVIEFGCGDGNQAKLFNLKNYTGYDISKIAIDNCNTIFKNDKNTNFYYIDQYSGNKVDLVLSLDVIFHLTEDSVFENYMSSLFSSSNKYVIIYSSNFNKKRTLHVQHRKFSDWIEKNIEDFKLIKHIPNKYTWDINNPNNTSFADFYIYQKNNLL